MVCVNKTLYKCSTFRITIDDSGAEEENIETPIYTNIKCYILKVYNKDFSQELALETDKSNILLRVWKKPNIKKGDLLDLEHRDLGDLGRYRVEDLDAKSFKARLRSVYLYLKKYNG